MSDTNRFETETKDAAVEGGRPVEPQASDRTVGGNDIGSEAAQTAAGAGDTAVQDERLAALEAEIAALKDKHLRALAEAENVRRRAAREKADAGKYAITAFARDLLAVADNMQRALGSVDPEARAADPALEALVAGVEMTEKALLAAFERQGISPMEAKGAPFDPHVHEAMFEAPNEEVPHGTVVQVVERGYMIHDRPLRPARVGVSRGGPKRTQAESSPESDGAPEDAGIDTAASTSSAYEQATASGEGAGHKIDKEL